MASFEIQWILWNFSTPDDVVNMVNLSKSFYDGILTSHILSLIKTFIHCSKLEMKQNVVMINKDLTGMLCELK